MRAPDTTGELRNFRRIKKIRILKDFFTPLELRSIKPNNLIR